MKVFTTLQVSEEMKNAVVPLQ